MKKVIQVILTIGILVLVYVMAEQIMTPMRFNKMQASREKAVIERLQNIRIAERAFKQKYSHFTGDFDSLIHFILHDSLQFRKSMGSEDDSIAVAKGLVKSEAFYVMVADTIFSPRKLTAQQVNDLRYIPFSKDENGKPMEFLMAAGNFKTESEVVVPVFECKAPYKTFLMDLDRQELINLIDTRKSLNKYPGLKVGAMDQANNEAGNWE